MITLYTFGPQFGLPDPSPFVTKAEMLLKMSSLPYRTDSDGFRKAPKGKLPYIDDDGERIADSTFIRWHLETEVPASISTTASRPSSARSPGRSRSWRRTISTGRWSMRAGRTTTISTRDRCNFFRKDAGAGAAARGRDDPAPVAQDACTATAWAASSRTRSSRWQRAGSMPSPTISGRSRSSWAPSRPASTPRCSPSSPARFVRCSTRRSARAAERHDNLRRYVGRMTARYYPDYSEIAGCKAAA